MPPARLQLLLPPLRCPVPPPPAALQTAVVPPSAQKLEWTPERCAPFFDKMQASARRIQEYKTFTPDADMHLDSARVLGLLSSAGYQRGYFDGDGCYQIVSGRARILSRAFKAALASFCSHRTCVFAVEARQHHRSGRGQDL